MKEEFIENIQEEDSQKGVYLTFFIDQELYGIHISKVIEIVGILPITAVPEMPNYIKGISNLRGQVMPIMDVRLRLKKQVEEYTDRTCLIIVNIKDILVGLIVDGVSEVKNLQEEAIIDNPMLGRMTLNKYIKEIGKIEEDMILLLDCEALISPEELEIITNIEV